MARQCCSPSSFVFFVGMIGAGLLAIYLADPEHDTTPATPTPSSPSMLDSLLHWGSDSSSSSSSSSSLPPLPSTCPPAMRDFLDSKYVHETLVHAKRLEKVFIGADYQACALHVIQHHWDTRPHSIYHLIQHSYLIPPEHRVTSITKALTSPNSRYVLAAFTAVEHTPPPQMVNNARSIAQWRYHCMKYAASELTSSVEIRQHALQSIVQYLSHPNDTLPMVALLTGETRHDALVWLLKNVPLPITESDMISWWKDAMKLGDETRTRVQQEAIQQKTSGVPTSSTTYIPSTNYTINIGLDATYITHKNDQFYSQLSNLMQRINEHMNAVKNGQQSRSRHILYNRLDIPDYDGKLKEEPVRIVPVG